MHHVAVQGQIIANDSGSMSWGHFLMVIKSHNLHHLIRRWIIHFPNKMIVFALIMHFYSGRSWTPTLPICRITSCGCAMIHNVTKESTSLACPHRAAVNLDYRFQWKPITLFSKRKWKSSQRPLKLPRKNCITNGSLIRGSSILVKKHATNDDQQKNSFLTKKKTCKGSICNSATTHAHAHPRWKMIQDSIKIFSNFQWWEMNCCRWNWWCIFYGKDSQRITLLQVHHLRWCP